MVTDTAAAIDPERAVMATERFAGLQTMIKDVQQ
jgi:hypothetical protein